MRVLQAVHGMPPAASGGTELYTRAISLALRAQGAEVAVLAREADPGAVHAARRRDRRDGLDVFLVYNTFRSCRTFADTYRDAAVDVAAREALEEVRPDVVHVQHLTGLGLGLLDACAERAVPVVVTLHDYWLLCQRGQLLDLDLERCGGPSPEGCARCLFTDRGAAAERRRDVEDALSGVAVFLAPSPTLREVFLRHGLPRPLLRDWELGLDLDRFAGLRREPSPVLRLGFVGSLTVSKAPHVLLEAFARLPEGRATLTVCGGLADYHGDRSYRARMEPLLRARGVRYLGPQDPTRLPEILAGLDVLVVPSVWLENAPLVIREAFAAGLPVVASDLGGMRDLVAHERSGLLFRPGDARDLARTMSRLLDDPALLGRLRAGRPRLLPQHEEAARLRRLYEDVVGGRLAAPEGAQ